MLHGRQMLVLRWRQQSKGARWHYPVEGLLSGLERKTCWSLAEQAGHADPQAMQRLPRTAVWAARPPHRGTGSPALAR
ncbi:hypothetical protein OG559_30075 [Micromonospora sp. NBC_01405]|uniref:hypothetical protein n=1 Tax=Micromonospora sp. NBC_01405 TaxID=2903589 RepID=UPI00324F3137